jgi:hypothetical protein
MTRYGAALVKAAQLRSYRHLFDMELQSGPVNIRDERTIREQVKSGFQLAGWVVFTLAFIILLLGSTASLLGKGGYIQPFDRAIAACILGGACVLIFLTARWWIKWFIGFMAYFALKAAILLILGYTPTVPAIAAPRLAILGNFASLLLATLICVRYINRTPTRLESLGLVAIVCCTQLLSESRFEYSGINGHSAALVVSGCAKKSASFETTGGERRRLAVELHVTAKQRLGWGTPTSGQSCAEHA